MSGVSGRVAPPGSPPEGASEAPAASPAASREGRSPRPDETPQGNTASLVRLGVAVAVIVALFVALGAVDLLIVILAVIAMVMLHELGHFVAAKRSHMKVTEYFLGFGPRLWSFRRGETEYGIKALPLGGYVKIPGMTNLEEVDPEDEPRTYRQQPFHNRLAVALAGSFMHFVMAFVLAWVAFTFIGAPSNTAVTIESFVHWQGHAQNAAQRAGLRVGDEVVSVNGSKVTRADQLQTAVAGSVGKPVTLGVERNGQYLTLHVTPVDSRSVKGEQPSAAGKHSGGVGEIGVEMGSPNVPENPFAAAGSAGAMIGRVTSDAVTGLGQVLSPHGISNYASELSNSKVAQRDANNGTPRFESIVGAVRTATQGAEAGAIYLFEVLIVLNIFIGLVNLLPMLPLDGGHVAIAVYERIRSRRGRPYHADAAKLLPVAYAVVLLLVVVFTTSLYLDLTHPVANPFH
jgi:membrane-associated protease RseP (regulator of RpoE activity)